MLNKIEKGMSNAAEMINENFREIPLEEEGTWTPVVSAGIGTINNYTSSGDYRKVGSLVTLNFNITISENGDGRSSLRVGGLPFEASTFYYGAGRNSVNGDMLQLEISGSRITARKYDNAYPVATSGSSSIRGTLTYFV